MYGSHEIIMRKKPTPAQNKNASDSANDQIKILIIDNDPSVSDVISQLFEKIQTDYVLKQEVNPENGLQTAKSWIPDLILTEIKFAKTSATAWLSKLKKDKRTENIFTVFITAENNRKKIIKAIEKKPDDIVFKPLNPENLEYKFTSWIQKVQENKSAPTIHFQNGFIRNYSRLNFKTNINYRIDEGRKKHEFRQAVTEDVSNDGLSIKLVDAPENLRQKISKIDTIVEFHLTIPGDKKRTENLKGEIKNIQSKEEGGQKIDILGLRFIDIPNEIRSKLVHAAHSKLQKKIKQKISIGAAVILIVGLAAFASVMIYSKKKVEKKLTISEEHRLQLAEEKNTLIDDVKKLQKMKTMLAKQTEEINQKMKAMIEREKALDITIKKKEKRIREMEGMVKELTDQWLDFLEKEKKRKAENERY